MIKSFVTYLALQFILYLFCNVLVKQVVDPAKKRDVNFQTTEVTILKMQFLDCHKPCSSMKLHSNVAYIKGAATGR